MKVLTALLLVGVLSTTAMAEDIRSKEYGYEYGDVVQPMKDDAFVVCGDCEIDRLDKAPKQLIGIRVSMPPQLPFKWADKSSGNEMHKSETARTPVGKDVLFKFNSKSLRKADKTTLLNFTKSIPRGAILDITGYTCSIGSKKYNLKLSERRARSVASFLKTRGLSIGQVSGKGECCPASNDKRLNRRVHITHKEN